MRRKHLGAASAVFPCEHAFDRAHDAASPRLRSLRLLDPRDVLPSVGVRELLEGLPCLTVVGERSLEIVGNGDRARLGVELDRDTNTIAGVDARRRTHVLVQADVRDATVDTRRRAPGVPADRDPERWPRAAVHPLEIHRHGKASRRLGRTFELDGEALRRHRRNHRVRGIMAALKIVRDRHLLRVTLAKPERRNAFDAALIAELTAAFADVGDARAVLLEGEGPSFCAGADVEWQRASVDLSYDENVEDAMRLYRMLETIDACPAPVVCCVHGFARGGGSGLVACADIAIAWPDAVFGFTEVRLGIIPAVISPFVLPRIADAARRYFVTGERFGADVALRIGLVQEVSEDAGRAAEAIVEAIRQGGPEAVREAKRLVRERPTGVDTAHLAAAR